MPARAAAPAALRSILLAFVKTAVEKHGGSIEVTSEPGKGSRFVLRLPAIL